MTPEILGFATGLICGFILGFACWVKQLIDRFEELQNRSVIAFKHPRIVK